LDPADQRSLRELAAQQQRDQATLDLKDPAKREDAQITLGLLDRGQLQVSPGVLVRIDTGEQIRAPLPFPGWRPP
jgi:hypothetical protein